LIAPLGDLYQGSFKSGKFHGPGRTIMLKGIYLGNWSNGNKSGPGKYTDIENTTYEGNWKHDTKNGFGIEIFKNGD
jgi:hypothetical protein